MKKYYVTVGFRYGSDDISGQAGLITGIAALPGTIYFDGAKFAVPSGAKLVDKYFYVYDQPVSSNDLTEIGHFTLYFEFEDTQNYMGWLSSSGDLVGNTMNFDEYVLIVGEVGNPPIGVPNYTLVSGAPGVWLVGPRTNQFYVDDNSQLVSYFDESWTASAALQVGVNG